VCYHCWRRGHGNLPQTCTRPSDRPGACCRDRRPQHVKARRARPLQPQPDPHRADPQRIRENAGTQAEAQAQAQAGRTGSAAEHLRTHEHAGGQCLGDRAGGPPHGHQRPWPADRDRDRDLLAYNLKRAVDHDSLGLFQQRPSSGWGSPRELTNPTYAAHAFYAVLVQYKGSWGTLWRAAQDVQRSAFPYAYQKHSSAALRVVTVLDQRF